MTDGEILRAARNRLRAIVTGPMRVGPKYVEPMVEGVECTFPAFPAGLTIYAWLYRGALLTRQTPPLEGDGTDVTFNLPRKVILDMEQCKLHVH